MTASRRAALAGLVGPALFVATFTLAGWLRPDYSARANFVSELALGPHGNIQIANFVVCGALFVVFARGLAAAFPAARAANIMLALIGVGLLLSGPFVMDPVSTPLAAASGHGLAHALLGALVFTLIPVSGFVWWRRFRDDPRWRPLAPATLAVAVVTTAAVLLMRIGPTRAPAAANGFNAWNGLIQRCVLIPFFAWQFIVALRLRATPPRSPP